MSDTYQVYAACSNCGWEGRVEIPKGQGVSTKECPQCGCCTLARVVGVLEKNVTVSQ